MSKLEDRVIVVEDKPLDDLLNEVTTKIEQRVNEFIRIEAVNK